MNNPFSNENKELKKKLSQFSLGEHNPFVDDSILKGGYRVVRTIKERDAIDCCHRKPGMRVMVVGQDYSFREYILKGQDTCSSGYWEEYATDTIDTNVTDGEVSLTEETEYGSLGETQKNFNKNISLVVSNVTNNFANLEIEKDLTV